jgi:uncharacterized protein with GYD domain
MKLKTYFRRGEYDDSVILEADENEIEEVTIKWLKSRGLSEKNITGWETIEED